MWLLKNTDNMTFTANQWLKMVEIKMMKKEDTVLLCRASASWDMYDNFKQRGDDFKKEVLKRG